jgi:uncharacterized protein (DUF58 family)
MASVERYLKPEVINQIKRLDLRAQFVVKGFMQGMHASPFHGFSVEFSEHRKYTPGDDPKDIDWLVFAKTDKYYVKKFEAETNLTGYLVMDLSQSMGYTLLGNLLSHLARLKPTGPTDIAKSLTQIAAMLRHKSLVMIFSDLLAKSDGVVRALRQLRHGGHDVILFHILDEAEVTFPFTGLVEFEEPETSEVVQVDATNYRNDYLDELKSFREVYRRECFQSGVDYVPLDTSLPFDKALMEYLVSRRARG